MSRIEAIIFTIYKIENFTSLGKTNLKLHNDVSQFLYPNLKVKLWSSFVSSITRFESIR